MVAVAADVEADAGGIAADVDGSAVEIVAAWVAKAKTKSVRSRGVEANRGVSSAEMTWVRLRSRSTILSIVLREWVGWEGRGISTPASQLHS